MDCLMMENKSLKIELESCHQKVAKSYRVNITCLYLITHVFVIIMTPNLPKIDQLVLNIFFIYFKNINLKCLYYLLA